MFVPVQDSLERLWRVERAQAEFFRERIPAILAEFDQNVEKPARPVTSGTNGRG